ncbi:MAG TPA: caspase family protein [Candidatus Dormibacteraeota bacterium]|nr:caspase family protein [Candidatus Dormibacteraeota bacterium]
MTRAGVFIGVDKTGNLQKLNDAATGAKRMYEWALAQGMATETNAKLITDAGGTKVDPDLIYEAIKEIVDGPGVDQLILYFAGHGVNISRNEYWLLTEAPVRTSAAVNVSGSVELARYCGVQHVVIISDACRVAPEGIQAQNVRGTDVFPNEETGDRSKPVDQFFACYLGKTAAELRDPAIAAGNYSALYTNALLDALNGTRLDVLESAAAAGDNARYVRPRRLENYLEIEIPRRVKAMNLQQKVNQNPDAIITSDSAWVSRIDVPPTAATGGPAGPQPLPPAPISPGSPASSASPAAASRSFRGVARQLFQSAASADRTDFRAELQWAKAEPVKGAEQLVDSVERIAAPFGPDHFETNCGIKVRGARIVDFFLPRGKGELGVQGDILRINELENPAVSVLLRFEGNFGTVVPAIPEFLAALTFEEGELVDVAYEPSMNSYRWYSYKDNAAKIRALRAIAASSSQHGRFRLEQSDAIQIAKQMQLVKGVDPTFAVYAAYAYHDLQAIDRIREMSGYMRDDLGVTLFDLALLGRTLIDKSIEPKDNIVPFFPLLSQGWALLAAHRVKLHPALWEIERTMRDSLWSLFNVAGLDKLKQAMQSKEVR